MKERNVDVYITMAKNMIVDYFNSHVDKTDSRTIDKNDVYIVWFCKTLQNAKALLSTTVPDGMYYEVTFNGDKDEAYIDAYKKWENQKVENPERYLDH